MSTAAFTFDNQAKLDLYELQTLPRGSILSGTIEKDQWEKQRMATNTKTKKTSLTFKERFFGAKKGRKESNAPTKYDVVRNVEIVDSSKGHKELKKDDYMPARTSYTHGHKLEPHSKTSWCDTCEELIWGLNIQAVRCQYCRYTCHSKCVSDIYVECPKTPAVQKSLEDLTRGETLDILDTAYDSKNRMENNNLPSFVTSIAELRKLIDKYNSQSNLIMTLHNNYTFDGFIRVQLNLNRPVNINTDVSNLTLKKAVARNKAGRTRTRRPVTEIFPDNCGSISSSSYDSGVSSSHSNDSGVSSPPSSPPLSPPPLSPVENAVLSSMYSRRKANRKLSFYMPKGTYKPLHVTSTTTVREVIEALLSKYNVTDNPKKYALFEKRRLKRDDDEVDIVYHRLSDEQRPLVLLLSWGASNTSRSFALKEDERETIEWLNFEVPELDNFLKILQMEEDHLMAQIYQKYETYRHALGNAMEEKQVAMRQQLTS